MDTEMLDSVIFIDRNNFIARINTSRYDSA